MHAVRQSSKAFRHSAIDSRLGMPASSETGRATQACRLDWHFGRQLAFGRAVGIVGTATAAGAEEGGAGALDDAAVAGAAAVAVAVGVVGLAGVAAGPGAAAGAGCDGACSVSRGRATGCGSRSSTFTGRALAAGSGGGRARSDCSSLRASLHDPASAQTTPSAATIERDITGGTIPPPWHKLARCRPCSAEKGV